MPPTEEGSSPSSSSSPKRLVQLDILRGVAILMVLGSHPLFDIRPDSQPLRFAYDLASKVGWTGVDLFFVLSGFLIGSLLFNELRSSDSLDVRRFLIRRVLKIWPAYYAYIFYVFVVQYARVPLALAVTGMPVRDSLWSAFKGVASNLNHFQDYLPTIRGHTWSLAVEEHFYVLLPFVLLALTRPNRRSGDWSKAVRGIPALAACLILACNLIRFAVGVDPGASFSRTHLRIDELFLGVLLAYGNCLRPGFTRAVGDRRRPLLAIGSALVVFLAFVALSDVPFRVPIAILLASLGSAAILMACVTTPLGVGWLGKAMESGPARLVAYVGTYSYSIYLWHLDLAHGPLNWLYRTGAFGEMHAGKTYAIATLAYASAAVAIGVVMGHLIELPALKLRDQSYPGRAPVITEDESGEGRATHPDRASNRPILDPTSRS